MTTVFSILLLFACTDVAPPPGPLTRTVDQLIAVDLDASGTDQLVSWREGSLEWSGGSKEIDGRLIGHSVGTLAGGREGLGIIFGRSKAAPKAEPTAWLLSSDGLTKMDINAFRFTDIQVVPDGVVLTVAYKDKRTQTLHVTESGTVILASSVMGLKARSLHRDGTVAIGRLYGDTPRSDGTLEIHTPDQPPREVPTVRGVRTLSLGDVDGDGHIDLLFADGWHFRYAKQAEAMLAVLPGPNFETPIRIGQIPGSYTIDSIDVVEPGRVLAVGTSSIVLFEQASLGWTQSTVAQRPLGGLPVIWRRNQGWLRTHSTPRLVFGQAGTEPIELGKN